MSLVSHSLSTPKAYLELMHRKTGMDIHPTQATSTGLKACPLRLCMAGIVFIQIFIPDLFTIISLVFSKIFSFIQFIQASSIHIRRIFHSHFKLWILKSPNKRLTPPHIRRSTSSSIFRFFLERNKVSLDMCSEKPMTAAIQSSARCDLDEID